MLNLGRHGCGWWGGPTISRLAPVPEIDPPRGWQNARPRLGMLGIIGRRRLQAVDIPLRAAMRAGHSSPVFRRGTYPTQFWTVAAVGG